MKKLSVIIPVGNEIHNINDVIESIDFADEILVVDSFSDDGTFEQANKLPVKVIRRKYDWILIIDADERVSTQLKNEIIQILKLPENKIAAYWIGRENYFMGKKVNYSGWQNDGVYRLFKKKFCKYENKYVHERLIVKGKVKNLKNKLIHNTYTDLNSHLKKLNRYAFLQAKDYDKTTKSITLFHFIIKPNWAFFKHYIIQLGFMDGVIGLVISFLRSYSVFMRYVNLWLIRRNKL